MQVGLVLKDSVQDRVEFDQDSQLRAAVVIDGAARVEGLSDERVELFDPFGDGAFLRAEDSGEFCGLRP